MNKLYENFNVKDVSIYANKEWQWIIIIMMGQ